MNFTPRNSERGVALTIVIIVIIIVSMLVAYALSAGFNQSKIASNAGGGAGQIQNYWTARSGIVDASWRIRHNVATLDSGETLGGSFTTASFDPPEYYLDLETHLTKLKTSGRPTASTTAPVTTATRVALINIGPVNTSDSSYPHGVRKIESASA